MTTETMTNEIRNRIGPAAPEPICSEAAAAWDLELAESERVARHTAEREARDKLRKLGIYTSETLRQAVKTEAKRPYLVEGLLPTRSLNLLVGDSGLGKTPLAIQTGLCVAAEIPLFGKQVQKGPVLYCDAESSRSAFSETLSTISAFLGLIKPPEDFYVWSPHWDPNPSDGTLYQTVGATLLNRVKEVQPSLVIVDALRTFWPEAEGKNRDAAEVFSALRKLKDVTWLILHHRRKVNQQFSVANLAENPSAWLQETAGALALINQSDTRWGVEPHSGHADLLLGGFVRGTGPMVPLDLARATDEDGNPIGYTLLTGAEHLPPSDRLVFDNLPFKFRFKDARKAMGGSSDSNTARLLKKCLSLALMRKEGNDYVKIAPTVEGME